MHNKAMSPQLVISVCHFLLQSEVPVFPQIFYSRMLNVCTNPDTWQQLALDGAGLPERHCVYRKFFDHSFHPCQVFALHQLYGSICADVITLTK